MLLQTRYLFTHRTQPQHQTTPPYPSPIHFPSHSHCSSRTRTRRRSRSCRSTIHPLTNVLLIFTLLSPSTSPSFTSTLSPVAEMTSMTNVVSGGRCLEARSLATGVPRLRFESNRIKTNRIIIIKSVVKLREV